VTLASVAGHDKVSRGERHDPWQAGAYALAKVVPLRVRTANPDRKRIAQALHGRNRVLDRQAKVLV
jgi:hypothetical protein